MSKNPIQSVQNLANSNPQLAQAWQVVQKIQSTGANKEEMLKMACQQSGMDYNQVKNNLNQFGIKI